MVVILTDTPSWGTRTIGTYRIATALRRHSVHVEVIDYISQWNFDELLKYLDQFNDVEWWGLSTRFQLDQIILNDTHSGKITQLNAEKERRLFKYLRGTNVPIVLGGPNVENALAGVQNLDVDHALIGYADLGVVRLHDHITHKAELLYSITNGIKVTDCNKSYGDIDLDKIGSEFVDSDYCAEKDVFPIEIGRGCIFHCAFCTFSHLGKRPGTYIRPKEDIKKEIVSRYQTYKTTQFLFVDDTFNDCVEKMQMIKEIREETEIPFEFWSYARLDLLAANKQMFDLVGECGWKAMTIGIETLNKASGKSVGKGADPMRLLDCLNKLRGTYSDLHIQANVIIGLPHDTEDSVRETVDLLLENNNLVDVLRINVLRIENPKNRTSSSKISKNPEKYGYRILEEQPFNLLWETEHMDRRRAKKLRNELQLKVNTVLGKYHHWSELLDIERNGKEFSNPGFPLEFERIDQYVHLKKQSKGLAI